MHTSERLYSLDRDKVGPCSCLDYHLPWGRAAGSPYFPATVYGSLIHHGGRISANGTRGFQ